MDIKKLSSTLLTSAAIFIAAQFDFYLFGVDFKISLAIVIIATIAYVTEYQNLVSSSAIAIIACMVLRIIRSLIAGETVLTGIRLASPEALFFTLFCLGLILYRELFGGILKRAYFIPVVIGLDFICNEVELLVRMSGYVANSRYLLVLLIVALIRGAITWAIITFMMRFRLRVQRKSEIERYNRAMIMISKLRGEVVWMERNMVLVEDTMNASFALYNELRESGTPEQASKALKVANDIHEVKKEYFLIKKGLHEAVDEESHQEGMMMSDILDLIRDAAYTNKPALKAFEIKIDRDFYTEKHYEFLTIFNNLVTNAIEANEDSEDLRIDVTVRDDGENKLIRVYNSGVEIPEDFREKVFNAGFSTKINYETGQISRGLGLCHVKDLVENEFGGSIILEDIAGGNAFSISIPVDMERA